MPEDISLARIDDRHFAPATAPKLTIVRQGLCVMGQRAIEKFLKRITANAP